MTRLIVFAKAPVPGQVKTRLARAIGAQRAADLASRMLEHALTIALGANTGAVELCGTPAGHPLLIDVARRHGVTLSAQCAGDLGTRMHSAFEGALSHREPALIMGTDCPSMTPSLIRQAAAALDTVDAAFVPSLDGGYVLIGLRSTAPSLFRDIPWSTPDVMKRTRDRMRALGWRWWESKPLRDIDEAQDLVTLPDDWRTTVAAALAPQRTNGLG